MKKKLISIFLTFVIFISSFSYSSANAIVAGGVISYELLMGLMGIGVSFGLALPKDDEEYWEYTRSLKKHLQLVDDDYLNKLDKSIKEWKTNNNNKPDGQRDPLKVPYLPILSELFDNVGKEVSSPSFVASNTLLNPIYHNPTSDYQMLPNRVSLEEGDYLSFSPIVSTNYGKTQIQLYYKHYSGNNYQVFWRNDLSVDKWSSQVINAKPSSFALFTYSTGYLYIRVMTDDYVIRSLKANEYSNIHIDVSKTFEKPSIEYNKTSPSVEKEEIILPNLPEIAIPNKDSLPDFDKGVDPPFDVESPFNPDTGGDTNPDTGGDTNFPSFPSFANGLDFSPLYVTNIKDKFPFSLPWDLAELFNVFDVDPQAPVFKFPILGEELTIDLTIFDEWASIGRFFVLIGFVVFLIFATIKIRG